jgi:hypothetical protein
LNAVARGAVQAEAAFLQLLGQAGLSGFRFAELVCGMLLLLLLRSRTPLFPQLDAVQPVFQVVSNFRMLSAPPFSLSLPSCTPFGCTTLESVFILVFLLFCLFYLLEFLLKVNPFSEFLFPSYSTLLEFLVS